MKNSILSLVLFLFTSFSLIGQDGGIPNGGSPNSLNGFVFGCKEPVKVNGTYTILFSDAVNNCQLFLASKGTGVGLWTGTTYQWNDIVPLYMDCKTVGSQLSVPKFIVQALSIPNDFVLAAPIKVTIGSNGSLFSSVTSLQGFCN